MQMKSLLAGAVGLLALTSIAAVALTSVADAADMAPAYKAPIHKAPAVTPPQASGYVELYGGWGSTRSSLSGCSITCFSESETIRGWALGGAGRGNYWFGQNGSVQVDAQAEGTSYKIRGMDTSSHASSVSYLVGGHINWRNAQSGLVGIFGGAGDAGGVSNSAQRHGLIGAEGQIYWNQLTLYGQVGYDTTINSAVFGIDSVHAWFVRGTGRYFFTPDVLLEGTVLYANGDIDFDFSGGIPSGIFPGSLGFQTWLWEAKLEWRLPTTPFSVFAKYRGSQTDYDRLAFSFGEGPNVFFDTKATDHRVLVGLRLALGQSTLLSNDRTGATLDIIDPLGVTSGPLALGLPSTPLP